MIIIKLFLVCFIAQGQSNVIHYAGDVSSNYIVRWAFQDLCKFSFDPRSYWLEWPTYDPTRKNFDPALVQAGDIIFVRVVSEFFKKVHPHIKVPYIVVCHGESKEKCQEKELYKNLNDPKIIAWYGIHPCPTKHPKFKPLPLGIFQDPGLLKHKQEINDVFKSLREEPKMKLLYMNFEDWVHPEREYVRKLFKGKSYCYEIPSGKKKPFLSYLKEMAQCKFALSPRGWGIDTYRTWESLLIGTIPIVISSSLNSLYEELPVLIIDKWTEITEEFLEQKYLEIQSKTYNLHKLYIEYWRDLIASEKIGYLRSSLNRGS